jgi:hypothetical protein
MLIRLNHLFDVEQILYDLDALQKPMISPIPSEFSLAVSNIGTP